MRFREFDIGPGFERRLAQRAEKNCEQRGRGIQPVPAPARPFNPYEVAAQIAAIDAELAELNPEIGQAMLVASELRRKKLELQLGTR